MHGAVVIESAVDKRTAADAGGLEARESGTGHDVGEKKMGRHLILEHFHRFQIPDGHGDQTEIYRAFQQPLGVYQLGEQFLHPAGVHAAIFPHLAKGIFVIGQVGRVHLPGKEFLVTGIVNVEEIFIGQSKPFFPGFFPVSLGQQGGVDRPDGCAGDGVKGHPGFHKSLVGADVISTPAAAAFQGKTDHSTASFRCFNYF